MAPTDRAPNGNAPEFTSAAAAAADYNSNLFREVLAALSALGVHRMAACAGLAALAWVGRREGMGAVGAFARWVTGKKGTIMRC